MMALFTGLTGLFVASVILALIRRDKMRVRHGVVWVLIAVAFLIFGFAPGLLDIIAAKLGVAYSPTVALVVGGSALIIKAVLADIELSRLEVRMARLVQRIAMLESDLRHSKSKELGDDQSINDS